MTGMTYRPELDGLRSVAVYLVLFFHAGMVTLGGGFIGVDLFFVLSGFLVTGVIMHEVDQRGTFDLGRFYARRVRRLLPAAVVVIIITAALQLLVSSVVARGEMVDDARASLLYFANWHFIAEARDYFAEGGEDSPYLHFWSLAIEEQFYIVFPLLVLLALRFGRRPIRLLAGILVAVLLLSVTLQLWRAASDTTYAYYATETRIYQLAAGALLTLVVRAVARYGGIPALARAATPVAALGLLSLLVTATRWVDVSPSIRGLLATMAALAVIGGVWWSQDGWVSRLLALPVPRYLGTISYGTYLWHWPVLLTLGHVFEVRPLVLVLLAIPVATGLAALSFTVFEHPIRRAPILAPLRWPTVAGGLAVSVLAAVLVAPQVLEVERRPALAGNKTDDQPVTEAAATLDRPVPPDLDLKAAGENTGPSTPQCTAEDLDACVRVRGDGQHVLLLGDSQARVFIPALEEIAREQDLTLSTNVKNGCPWQMDQVNTLYSEEGQAACVAAREDFFAEVLPEMDVDVVLAIGLSRSEDYWKDHLRSADGSGETLEKLQIRTTQETVAAITDTGAELVISRSLLGTDGFKKDGPDPIECLASAQLLADCAVAPPESAPPVDGAYDVEAAESDSVHTVDLNPVICPDHPLCAPVIDGTVVWRDSSHVTTTILHERREQLWRRLRETGAIDR